MLAAMQSETGRFADAVTTAQAAIDLARRQENGALAASLVANLARYQAQAQSETQRGAGTPR